MTEKISKYVALVIVGIAVFFGMLELQKQRPLEFKKAKEVNTTLMAPHEAKIRRFTPVMGDVKDNDPLKMKGYLQLEVNEEIEPKAIQYNDLLYPLREVSKGVYQTPLLLLTTPKQTLTVNLIHKPHKKLYFIPKKATIQLKEKIYILTPKGVKKLNPLRTLSSGYLVDTQFEYSLNPSIEQIQKELK
ncbi:MAG: hypothetical protein GXO61_01735 [Epsilonproteobacteria bacterium]|nr:hypothetical protein [Campylobacterota bacterium]